MGLFLLRWRFVVPFYRKMMLTNATELGEKDFAKLARRRIREDDVIFLLGSEWRDRVMGAWLAVRKDSPAVREALLESLATAQGYLTVPPLASVAVLVAGTEALESLRRYRAQDLVHEWGAVGFVDAALEHLGAGEESLATPEDREQFMGLLAMAERLCSYGSA